MSIATAKNTRPIILSLVSLAVVFGGLYAWRVARNSGGPPPPRPPALVSTLRVQPRSVADDLQAVGSLQAVREVMLAPDTSGRVTAINFTAGQLVKSGAALVRLFDSPEQADRTAAVARSEFAEIQLQRSQELAPSGAEPRERLQQRRAEAAQASAAVGQLDARIQQKNIQAPFAGQLGVRRINLGQYLNAGDGIATLTQLDPLYVNFTVPQQELPRVAPGALVQVTVDAASGRVFSAKVSAVEPRVDGETRNVSIQATLPNPDNLLKSGMYAVARLSLPSVNDAIVLPLTAIQTSASGDSVVLVQGANAQGIGKAVSVPVVTGRRLGEEVVVTHGVKADDIVVIAGQNRLQPGGSVKINAETSAGAAAKSPAASR